MNTDQTTRLLQRAGDGEASAAADLLPLVYDELRALAERYFRNERRDHTLQPTALVHEAFARLVDQSAVEWKNRAQFFSIAARAMRNLLVDHARARSREKRGGGWQEVTLAAAEHAAAINSKSAEPLDMLALEEALTDLAALDERKARLVELRFFAGLPEADAAAALGLARSTASEEWRMARAWLASRMKGERA